MMMIYKGSGLQARSFQNVGTGNWTISVSLMRFQPDHIQERRYSANDEYPTKEEAIQHCFSLGKQIVDG